LPAGPALAAAMAVATIVAAMAAGAGSFWMSAGAALLLFGLGLAAWTRAAGLARHGVAARDQEWHAVLDSCRLGLATWDRRSNAVLLSQRWQTWLGLAGRPVDSPADFMARVHADDAPALQQMLDAAAQGQAPRECRMARDDGSWIWLELQVCGAGFGSGNDAAQVMLTARHIDKRITARERQHLSDDLFEHLHEGLLITDGDFRVIEANAMFTALTGHSRAQLLGRVPMLLNADATGGTASAMHAGLRQKGMWRGETVIQRLDGESRTLQLTVSAVKSTGGSALNHVVAVSDITLARQQFEQLQRQAHFDELTRLPNRVRLAQVLESALVTSEQEGSLLTLCYLDLDHFKPVNDRFGHEVGLLVEVAERLRRSLRSWNGGDDVVARIGGDEFVLLLRCLTLEESRHAVERVLRHLAQPYALGLDSGPVTVTASIGATVFPHDRADAETLLRHADHAMYGAKQAGRSGYLFFDTEHDKLAEARYLALGRVREALDADEFRLMFQPKVDMHDGTVLGMEALLRWHHPDNGVVAPSEFLPLIEHTGLSVSVGKWVLASGIEQLAQWLRQGLDFTLSINVTARHLQEPQFAQHLAAMLADYPPSVAQRLVIEVLETAALADIDHTSQLMHECHALGVRFALDDFGTGYSTFTYLKRLPLDLLKIDKSFIRDMLGDPQDLAIVEGVIGLSRTFGCTAVAEGVETPEQAQRLLALGCRIGQGNGIAPAMPAQAVAPWVRNYHGMATARSA
jgi:diguanylate cyclase (GGDEF)-like protein/PAS domain S-box-containing protein